MLLPRVPQIILTTHTVSMVYFSYVTLIYIYMHFGLYNYNELLLDFCFISSRLPYICLKKRARSTVPTPYINIQCKQSILYNKKIDTALLPSITEYKILMRDDRSKVYSLSQVQYQYNLCLFFCQGVCVDKSKVSEQTSKNKRKIEHFKFPSLLNTVREDLFLVHECSTPKGNRTPVSSVRS